MNGYIIDTSKGKMEVVAVQIEETDYNKARCIKSDGTYVFKSINECFNTYSDAKNEIDEACFISSFKKKMKHKKYKTWKCAYCGRIMYDRSEVTVDHVVPKLKGGKTTRDNLVICCSSCNKMKSSKHKNHYIKLMKSNAKIKMKKPNRFKGKIKNVAHKSQGLNMETIARMDGNMISLTGLNIKKNKQNMVDRVLSEYNSRRMSNERNKG